jgi:hypothetical protein
MTPAATGGSPQLRSNVGAQIVIGTAAESAVNQVVSTRMAKKQQMRWSDEGAHALALVRVADLNGELSIDSLGEFTLPRRSDVERSWRASMALAA